MILLGAFLFGYADASEFPSTKEAKTFPEREITPLDKLLTTTVSVRVSSDNDDGEERVSNGETDLESSDLELIKDGSHDQIVGMRFRNITIPQGATITNAYIEFETDETGSSTTNLTMRGQDIDDAPTFSDSNNNISNRTKTSASVAWNNVPAWNTVNEKHQTPDLSAIIQEIVNRGGWSSGNDVVIIIEGSGTRTAESHDGEAAAAPLLVIDYGSSPPNLNDLDNDGISNECDNDDDGDGILDVNDPDDDNDGILDDVDTDDDNDGILDVNDSHDNDNDGLADDCDDDDDNDGIADLCDSDADGDGILDINDDDDDNDGILDVNEHDNDGDGILDENDDDDDNDGILDVNDDDNDGDGILNSNDDDDDNDGVLDMDEAPDSDNDGISDDYDNDDDNDGILDSNDDDDDGDGILDVNEHDNDADGIEDECDNDDDNDGIPDASDDDRDGDGILNINDNDDDNDGVLDYNEPHDNDGDGISDDCDSDDDNDGIDDDSDNDDDGDGEDDSSDDDDNNDGLTDTPNCTVNCNETVLHIARDNGQILELNLNTESQIVVTTSPFTSSNLNAFASNPDGGIVYYGIGQTVYFWNPATNTHGTLADLSGQIASNESLSSGGGGYYGGNLYLGTEDGNPGSNPNVYRLPLAVDGLSTTGTAQNLNVPIDANTSWGDLIVTAESNNTVIFGALSDNNNNSIYFKYTIETASYELLRDDLPNEMQIGVDVNGDLWGGALSGGTLQKLDKQTGNFYGNSISVSGNMWDLTGPINCPQNIEICDNGIDDDGDGLIDCADPDCGSYQIFAVAVTAQTGVNNPANALNGPDGAFAKLYDSGDRLTLDFGSTIPKDSVYSVVWRRKTSYGNSNTADMVIEESADNLIYTENPFRPSTTDKVNFSNTAVTANSDFRYLRFREETGTDDDFELDAVSYTISCTPTIEICDNGIDDDGDGLIDCADPDCANYNDAGTISGDETTCGAFDPSPITNATSPTGGTGGTLSYSWQQSIDGGSTWTDITGDTLDSYDPAQITQTTNYRRGARRFSCATWIYSNSVTKTVVNNYTDGGAISGDESACGAFDPAAMTETTPPSGGSGTIEYQWQDSTANGNWADISGAVSATYDPSTISATTYYRRGVRRTGCSPFLFSNIVTKTVATCGNPEVEFCTYNLNLLYGDAFNIRDYLHVKDESEPVNWSQITFTYTDGGANDPTNPVDWNLTAFNNGQTVTVSSADNFSGSGNHGDGRYRIYVLRNGETEFDDKMTIRVENQSSDVNSAKCATNSCDNVTTAGTVGSDETSCAAFDPVLISEQTSPGGGSGSLFYQWEQSLDAGLTWKDIINANSATFDPGTISQTTAYRRGVLRTSCTNIFYSNVVTKAVSNLPTLTNDSFNAGCPGLNYSNNVASNDSALSNPVFSILSNPANGTVTLQNDGSFTYTPTNPICGTEQFTYQVCNDNSNCCATATADLDFSDNVNPVLSNIPADITINCDDDIPLPAQVQVWENCTSISMDIDEVSTQGADSCALYDYVLTRTWTVTDFCGNSNSGSQNITLEDKTAPSIYRIHTLSNGRKLVAGVMDNVTQRWKTILFPISFGNDPLVFSQVVSKNENAAVIARMRNISTSQFQLRVQEEENNDGLHIGEKVAWIAIEEGSQAGNPAFETGKISAGNNPTVLSFKQSYAQAPAFIESVQTFLEIDPVSLRYQNMTGTGTSIYLEEETSLDAEIEHANETVAYLAIGAAGNLLDQSGDIIGETGTIAVANNLQTVPFTNSFHHPVVILGGISNNETDPTAIRVTNITNANFQVQLEEWDYENGVHVAENLSYLVVEGSIPFDATVECSAIPEPPELGAELIAVDNCDASVEITFTESPNSFDCATDTLFTRTWSVADECGNSAAFTQTFILRDTTPPDFSLPPDVTLTCADNRNNLQLTGDVLDENDNCTPSLQAVYSDDSTNVSNCLGTINRIWTLTDNCGNSVNKTQTITLDQTISGVVLDIKVLLSGALIDNDGSALMRDDLRANNRLPQLEPYTAIPYFQHFGEGGLETCDQAVLDITGNDAIVDWIMVELRNPYMPDSILASRSALLQRDGDVVDVDGTSLLSFQLVPSGDYYIAVRHRNHLGIMSSNPYPLSLDVTTVDFTDSATDVFGDNSRVSINGEMALWAGDLNGDRKVIYQGPSNDIFHLFIFTMLDANNINQLANFVGQGYEVTDLNLDGKIIYQGPNNDRSKMLFYGVLKSPENSQQLANFILNEKLP